MKAPHFCCIIKAVLPQMFPLRLGYCREPFSHPDWLFELKYDGFRSLAYVRNGAAHLVSRNGNKFGSFADLNSVLPSATVAANAIFDGEIVCLDKEGRPDFRSLFYRRGMPVFYAFDVLWLDGRDTRSLPLIQRKNLLRQVIPESRLSRLRYLDHVEEHGTALFDHACTLDLEGVVAKPADSPYKEDGTWLKVKNRKYSQTAGRNEMFEREPLPKELDGWSACSLVCAEAL